VIRWSRRYTGELCAGAGLRAGRGVRAGLGLLAAAGLASALTACAAGQIAQTAFVSPSVDGANGQVGAIALRAVTVAFPDGGQYAAGSDARLQATLVSTATQEDALVEVRTPAAQRVTLATSSGASGSATPSSTASSSPAASASASGTGSATASATGSSSASATATPTPSASVSASAGASVSGSTSASATGSAAPPETSAPIPVPAGNLVACRDAGPVLTLVGLTQALLPSQVVPITFVFRDAGQVTLDVPVAVPLTQVSLAPTVSLSETAGG
jgi:copper(I)-binding protein